MAPKSTFSLPLMLAPFNTKPDRRASNHHNSECHSLHVLSQNEHNIPTAIGQEVSKRRKREAAGMRNQSRLSKFESSEKANCRVGILIIDVASSFSGRVGDFSLGDRSTGEYVGAVAHHETDLASHVFDTVTCGDSARTCMEGNSKSGERKSKSEKEEGETGRSVAAKPRQEGAFCDKVLACALHNCLVCAYLLGGRLGNPTQQKSHRTGSQ